MSAAEDSYALLEHLWPLVSDLVLDAHGSIRDLGRLPPFLRPELVRQHPSHQVFVAAVTEHPTLGALVPLEDAAPRWISGFEPTALADRLINAALWHCALQAQLTEGCLNDYLRFALTAVERLINGEGVDVPVFVGFGTELPPGTTVDTPWGLLAAWRPEYQWLLSGLEYDPGRGTVLLSTSAVSTNIVPSKPPGTIHAPSIEDERWRRLALALLLAQDPATARPTQPWFCGQAQLLGHGMSSSETRQFIKGPSFAVDQLDDVARWIRLSASPRLSIISIDRVVGMAGRLVDHVDAFIDGVIVWENLFGTGDSQELSYRVSTNMACVLSDSPTERLVLQEEIKKLYGLRSQVVHGGKRLSGSEAADARARAQVLTLKAVRRLLDKHPDLVGASPREFMAFVLGANGTVP